MYKQALLIIGLIISASAWGQDSLITHVDSVKYEWKKVREFALDSGEVWQVDVLDNIYITKGSEIVKYDSAGVLKFRQSIKSFGKATQIEPVNTMKLIYFSEEQQSICFLDNTLSVTEDCVDLIDYEIYNAALITSSSRPELLWVYDNVNSTLKLISLVNVGEIMQEIINIKGLLNLSEVDQIYEEDDKLYLLERDKKILILDFYGGLIDNLAAPKVQNIALDPSDQGALLELTDDTFNVLYPESAWVLAGNFPLPIDGAYEFIALGDYLYLRTSEYVHKYLPLFHN